MTTKQIQQAIFDAIKGISDKLDKLTATSQNSPANPPSNGNNPSTPTGNGTVPTVDHGLFNGAKLFVDDQSDAAKYVANTSNPSLYRYLMSKISGIPQAIWLGDWYPNKPDGYNLWTAVTDLMKRHKAQGALPVFVVYNITGRDNGSYSAGGAATLDEYYSWIGTLGAAIGNDKAVIILEPDAIAHALDNPSTLEARINTLNTAIDILAKQPNVSIYVDASHPNWKTPTDIVNAFNKIRLKSIRGFSVNVSNFVALDKCIPWADEIATKLGGKHYIIDTSRNGNGASPESGEAGYINPSGRALGVFPSTQTNHEFCDAYLWVKFPTGSDGARAGAPAAGVFFPEYVLDLIRNTKFQ